MIAEVGSGKPPERRPRMRWRRRSRLSYQVYFSDLVRILAEFVSNSSSPLSFLPLSLSSDHTSSAIASYSPRVHLRVIMVTKRHAVVEERPIDGKRPLRVICVGAGISGLI